MQTQAITVIVREDGTISVYEYDMAKTVRLFGTTSPFDAGADVEKRIYRIQKEIGAV